MTVAVNSIGSGAVAAPLLCDAIHDSMQHKVKVAAKNEKR